jgi:hypothetical protein
VGVGVAVGVAVGVVVGLAPVDVPGNVVGDGLPVGDEVREALELADALEVRVVGLALEVRVVGLALEVRVVGLAEAVRLGDPDAVGLVLMAAFDTASIALPCGATKLAATVGRVAHGLVALSRKFRPWPATAVPAPAVAATSTRNTPSVAVCARPSISSARSCLATPVSSR